MAVIAKKTKKRIAKQVRKMVKEHTPEIVMGIATAAAASAIHAVQDRTSGKSKKKKRAKA